MRPLEELGGWVLLPHLKANGDEVKTGRIATRTEHPHYTNTKV